MELSSKDGQILQHIVRYCNQIDTTIDFFHLTKDDFADNFFVQNALAMPISQIGELVKKLTSETLCHIRLCQLGFLANLPR